MRVVGIEAVLQLRRNDGQCSLERLGVIPIHIDGRDYQEIILRLEFLPREGGCYQQFIPLDELRRIK